jgi:hypothetical protein
MAPTFARIKLDRVRTIKRPAGKGSYTTDIDGFMIDVMGQKSFEKLKFDGADEVPGDQLSP